jgi:RNA polymerase sigma-70 factor (ECF subfamily)
LGAKAENMLVIACKNGDRSAYAGLVQAHSSRVFAICLGMVGNRHDAEDMAQQTLLRGFMRIGSLRNSQRFGHWVGQIARNSCIDLIRRRRTQPMVREPRDSGPNEDPETYRQLEAALAELNEDYRLPLLLFYFNGRSTKSIAETLDISQAAVQTRLSRARRRLRKLLAEKGEHR